MVGPACVRQQKGELARGVAQLAGRRFDQLRDAGTGLEFEPPVVAGAGANVAARCAVRLAGCRAGKRVNFSQWLSFSKAWMLRNELRLMSTLFLFLLLLFSGNIING